LVLQILDVKKQKNASGLVEMHYYYKNSLPNENTDMAYCAFVVKSPPNIPSNQLVVKTKQDIRSTAY